MRFSPMIAGSRPLNHPDRQSDALLFKHDQQTGIIPQRVIAAAGISRRGLSAVSSIVSWRAWAVPARRSQQIM